MYSQHLSLGSVPVSSIRLRNSCSHQNESWRCSGSKPPSFPRITALPNQSTGRSNRTTLCASLQSQGLSKYTRPVDRSAESCSWRHGWLEHCVRDIVRNLDRAPFLQAVYERRGHLSSRTEVVTHCLTRELNTAPEEWLQSTHGTDQRLPKTIIYVHEVPDEESCALNGGQRRSCCDTSSLVDEGSIGDCEGETPGCSGYESRTRYWGVVVQSTGRGPGGCYLLKTQSTLGGHCTCTQFSLTKVCQGVSLYQQETDSWRA